MSKTETTEHAIRRDLAERLAEANRRPLRRRQRSAGSEAIIRSAASASEALQREIIADGGLALAELSRGMAAPEFSMLVADVEAKRAAARAAEAALPLVRSHLTAVHGEAFRISSAYANPNVRRAGCGPIRAARNRLGVVQFGWLVAKQVVPEPVIGGSEF